MVALNPNCFIMDPAVLIDPYSDRCSAALQYARQGWRVFPAHSVKNGQCSCGNPTCASKGKHPHIEGWQRKATCDEDQIIDWWTEHWPNANVAIALGNGLVDIEYDPRHGGDASYIDLQRRLGTLPDTVTWISGGGGEHHIFTLPKGIIVHCQTDMGLDLLGFTKGQRTGVDVKSDGGYAIAPPSSHELGSTYRFGNLHPDAIDTDELPQAWIDYLTREKQTAVPAGSSSVGEGDPILEGSRNTSLTKMAGFLRRGGLAGDEMFASLMAINDKRCKPPLDRQEVATIAQSVARYEPDQITVAQAEGWVEKYLSPSGTKGKRQLAVRWFSDTQEIKPEWLWPCYLMRGSTAVVGGRQGTSKGLFTIDLAARLTRGDPMPDGTGAENPTKVLIVTREDDPERTLKARLRLAGADMTRVEWSVGDFTDNVPIPTMAMAADLIAERIREHGIGLVIIDPLGAWVEDDANNGQQIRAVIDPMNRVARETGCTVLFVAHLRKATADEPMDAFAGSVQVTAACRTAMLITSTPEKSERMLQVVKTNFRRPERPLMYRLITTSTDIEDPPILAWRTPTSEDLAIAATTKNGVTQVLQVSTALLHLADEHRPLKEAARSIRKALSTSHRGLTVQAVVDALNDAIASGQAYEGTDRHSARTVGRQPAPQIDSVTERAIAYWDEHPDASVREVADALGCSRSAVGRARSIAIPSPSKQVSHCPTPLVPLPRDTGTETNET